MNYAQREMLTEFVIGAAAGTFAFAAYQSTSYPIKLICVALAIATIAWRLR